MACICTLKIFGKTVDLSIIITFLDRKLRETLIGLFIGICIFHVIEMLYYVFLFHKSYNFNLINVNIPDTFNLSNSAVSYDNFVNNVLKVCHKSADELEDEITNEILDLLKLRSNHQWDPDPENSLIRTTNLYKTCIQSMNIY